MVLDRFSILWLNKTLIRQFLIAATIACLVEFWSGSYRPAHSRSESLAIEMPVYGQILYDDLISQAEFFVGTLINDQFSRSTDLSAVQVIVTGNRNGEVIPILVTTVSRAQWQETPQVSIWTEYYKTSYALLQRHDVAQETTVATAPFRTTATNIQERASQIDRAFDEGRLTGRVAQEYLNDLD